MSGLTGALDAALIAEPALAELPGRFLFVLDDGRGDVVDLRLDLGYRATGPEGGHLLVGGPRSRPAGDRQPRSSRALVRLALGLRPGPHGHRCLARPRAAELDRRPGPGAGAPRPPAVGEAGTPLGAIGDAASVAVPLAMLTAAQVAVVEQLLGDGSWWSHRGVAWSSREPAAALPALAAVGLVVDDEGAWSQLSACVGAPGCARSRVDTTALASALVGRGSPLPRTHLSGCERRCGAPTGDHLDLVAPTLAEAVRAVGGRR